MFKILVSTISVPANFILKINTGKMVMDYDTGATYKFFWATAVPCLKKIILSHWQHRFLSMWLEGCKAKHVYMIARWEHLLKSAWSFKAATQRSQTIAHRIAAEWC